MFKVAIISKPQKPEVATLLPELIAWLRAHEYEALLDVDSAAYLGQQGIERGQLPAEGPGLVGPVPVDPEAGSDFALLVGYRFLMGKGEKP